MNTQDIMNRALALANLDEAPCDSVIMNPKEEVKKVLIGIDLDVAELTMAKQLGYDTVISHHPKGDTASTDFYNVMDIQIDKMVEYGVPINRAQKALAKKKYSVSLSNHVGNYDKNPSAAKLLGLGYMNIHMPADIIGEKFLQSYLDETFVNHSKKTLGDVVEALNDLEIYKNAIIDPVIRVGSKDSYAGKIVVLFAGGTNGGSDVYKAYYDAGVGTIICMHAPEDVIKSVREQNFGNIIVAGHMPSDSIGLNKIVEDLKSQGLEVDKISGIL